MSGWFDDRARGAGRLPEGRRRKVKAIKEALGKSDRRLEDHFVSFNTFERAAVRAGTGRVSTAWLETIRKLRAEFLRAGDRLDELDTGLRAERRLRLALKEAAAGVDAWHTAMRSNDLDEIDAAMAALNRHMARADRLGKLGSADLEDGR